MGKKKKKKIQMPQNCTVGTMLLASYVVRKLPLKNAADNFTSISNSSYYILIR